MTPSRPRSPALLGAALAAAPLLTGCGLFSDPDLVVYSGRNETLVGPVIERFEDESGLDVEVRYGDTAELAAQLLEEGDASPADVFFSQDAGALGALTEAGLLADLPAETLGRVPAQFTGDEGTWVGITGRSRVVAYDPDDVAESDIPDDVLELAAPEWAGRVGIAPTNASFQSFVTALRLTEGEDVARTYLEDLQANDVQLYDNNLAALDALEAGEIDVALINHYYVTARRAELGEENVRTQLKFLPPGTAGALVNVAGIGLLADAEDPEGYGQDFLDFLLTDQTQTEFVERTGEYPLTGVPGPEGVPSLEELGAGAGVQLGELASLDVTLDLLTEVGLI